MAEEVADRAVVKRQEIETAESSALQSWQLELQQSYTQLVQVRGHFNSMYAPLNGSGPLPPGLRASTVKTAFKYIGIGPSRMLKAAPRHPRRGTVAERLLNVLHDPDFRAALKLGRYRDEGLAPLHYALYRYFLSKPRGEGIYARLIEPATYRISNREFLDGAAFGETLQREAKELSLSSETLPDNSDAQMLAHLALAFGLLQSDHAKEIVSPILRLGLGYQNFFGALLLPDCPHRDSNLKSLQEIKIQPEQTAPVQPDQAVAPPHTATKEMGGDGQQPHKEAGSELRQIAHGKEVKGLNSDVGAANKERQCGTEGDALLNADPGGLPSRIDASTASSGEPETAAYVSNRNSTITESDGLLKIETAPSGLRAAELDTAMARHQLAQQQRQATGGELSFDRAAFEDARTKEKEWKQRLDSIIHSLNHESRLALSRLEEIASSYACEVQFEQAPPDPYSLARRMDSLQPALEELESLVDKLNCKIRLYENIEPRLELQFPCVPSCSSIEDLRRLLANHLETAENAILDARERNEALRRLEQTLLDCLSPVRAKSLAEIQPDLIFQFMTIARYDESLGPLLPMLIRLLSEKEAWRLKGLTKQSGDFVQTLLNEAAASNDIEYYQSITSFLVPETLQELLKHDDPQLSRHIVLSSFNESLARDNLFFFNQIWPFNAWHNRTECIGERLTKVFDAFPSACSRTRSLRRVIQMMIHQQESVKDAYIESERLRRADELVTLLSNPPNRPKIYGRMGESACRQFLASLAPRIHNRELRWVRTERARLGSLFRQGEIQSQVEADIGLHRNIERTHRQYLERYIDRILKAIDEWIDYESHFSVTDAQIGEAQILEVARRDTMVFVQRNEVDSGIDPEVGTVAWLENEIAGILTSAAQGQYPDRSFAFFGTIPPLEDMVSRGDADGEEVFVANGDSSLQEWLVIDPSWEHLWSRYATGQSADYVDILQDAIAVLLFKRNRSTVQTMESYMSSRQWAAAVEAGRHPRFVKEHRVRDLASEAEKLQRHYVNLEQRSYRIDARLTVPSKSFFLKSMYGGSMRRLVGTTGERRPRRGVKVSQCGLSVACLGGCRQGFAGGRLTLAYSVAVVGMLQADQREGRVVFPGELTDGLCYVGGPRFAQYRDCEVPERGHHPWCVSRSYL